MFRCFLHLKHIMKSLVLDVDETLVHTGTGQDYKFQIEEEWVSGTIRPHLREFLWTVNDLFDVVAVWSAGERDYVHGIVDRVFPYQPDLIWTREECDTYVEWGSVCRVKPLTKMFGWDIGYQTWIVDDSLCAAKMNPQHHIPILPFEGDLQDRCLADLAGWFINHPHATIWDTMGRRLCG